MTKTGKLPILVVHCNPMWVGYREFQYISSPITLVILLKLPFCPRRQIKSDRKVFFHLSFDHNVN